MDKRKKVGLSEEDHRKLKMDAARRGMSMYKLLPHIIMRYYDPDHEVPTIQEGEATPVPKAKTKYSAELRKDMDALIQEFSSGYITRRIGRTVPYMRKDIVYRTMADPMQHYGLARMKELLSKYFSSDDKFLKATKWNLLTFLSMNTLNRLEQ